MKTDSHGALEAKALARECRRTEGRDNGLTSHGGAAGGAVRETTVPGEQPHINTEARAVVEPVSGRPQIPLHPPLRKGERGGFVSPRKQEIAVISGRVLCLSDKAVKFWTLIKTEWIPLSLIIRDAGADRDPPLREGEEARLTIPYWFASKRGWVE